MPAVGGGRPGSRSERCTTTPAALLGLGDRLGRIAPGMLGNLVITDGDLFNRRTRVIETWVDGRRFERCAIVPRKISPWW